MLRKIAAMGARGKVNGIRRELHILLLTPRRPCSTRVPLSLACEAACWRGEIRWESGTTCEWPIEPPMGTPLNHLPNRRPLNDHVNGPRNDTRNDPRKRLLNVNRLFTAEFLIGESLGCSTRVSILCVAQQLCISHIHSLAL